MSQINIKKNLRVLIAGAKFGEVYLNAFIQSQTGLELAGLFSRGSHRAQQLAHDFGIPLYTNLDDIPDDIDIVCVVVRSTVAQGEGSQLAAEFIHRGFHVLQEHPLHPDDLSRLQDLSKEHNRLYWVNSFYPHVSACRCWIDRAACIRGLLHGQLPSSANFSTSRQLLYSTLDLLLQAYGVTNIHQVRPKIMDGADETFIPVTLELPSGNTVNMRLQSYLDPSDPDMFSVVMHQATLFWPSGYLTLESTYGPVVWTGAFFDPQHGSREQTMFHYANDVDGYAQPPSIVLHDAPHAWGDVFEIDAAEAIGNVLQSMRHTLAGGPTPPYFEADYQLDLARLWLALLHIAPPVVERRLIPPRMIKSDELKKGTPLGEPLGEGHG